MLGQGSWESTCSKPDIQKVLLKKANKIQLLNTFSVLLSLYAVTFLAFILQCSWFPWKLYFKILYKYLSAIVLLTCIKYLNPNCRLILQPKQNKTKQQQQKKKKRENLHDNVRKIMRLINLIKAFWQRTIYKPEHTAEPSLILGKAK